jgi:predicted amidohydrolase
MYVLLSNHVGMTGGWATCGASAIWNPYGDVIAQAARDRDEVITALLDPEVLADIRERETVLADFTARRDSPSVGGCVIQCLD